MTVTTSVSAAVRGLVLGLIARLDRALAPRGPSARPGEVLAVHITPYISAQGAYLHDLPDGRVVVMAGGRAVAGRRAPC